MSFKKWIANLVLDGFEEIEENNMDKIVEVDIAFMMFYIRPAVMKDCVI